MGVVSGIAVLVIKSSALAASASIDLVLFCRRTGNCSPEGVYGKALGFFALFAISSIVYLVLL